MITRDLMEQLEDEIVEIKRLHDENKALKLANAQLWEKCSQAVEIAHNLFIEHRPTNTSLDLGDPDWTNIRKIKRFLNAEGEK